MSEGILNKPLQQEDNDIFKLKHYENIVSNQTKMNKIEYKEKWLMELIF